MMAPVRGFSMTFVLIVSRKIFISFCRFHDGPANIETINSIIPRIFENDRVLTWSPFAFVFSVGTKKKIIPGSTVKGDISLKCLGRYLLLISDSPRWWARSSIFLSARVESIQS